MRETHRLKREHLRVTGERLATLMVERDVSLSAIAASARIQRSTLESLCAGERGIPSDVLATIALMLGTNAEYLKGSTDVRDAGVPHALP